MTCSCESAVCPAARKPEPKNYVAGDTVEFDVAGEEEKGNGRQMELF